jgi:hypothetical protein
MTEWRPSVITTPHVRRSDATDSAVRLGMTQQDPEPGRCSDGCPAARTITLEQLDRAVAQLRERPGRSAAEQILAVMRAFDLTVARPVAIPGQH